MSDTPWDSLEGWATYPSCVTDCFFDSLRDANCADDNVACACRSSTKDDVILSVLNCDGDNCPSTALFGLSSDFSDACNDDNFPPKPTTSSASPTANSIPSRSPTGDDLVSTPADSNGGGGGGGGLPTSTTVGLAVGFSVAGVIAIILLLLWLRDRKKRKSVAVAASAEKATRPAKPKRPKRPAKSQRPDILSVSSESTTQKPVLAIDVSSPSTGAPTMGRSELDGSPSPRGSAYEYGSIISNLPDLPPILPPLSPTLPLAENKRWTPTIPNGQQGVEGGRTIEAPDVAETSASWRPTVTSLARVAEADDFRSNASTPPPVSPATEASMVLPIEMTDAPPPQVVVDSRPSRSNSVNASGRSSPSMAEYIARKPIPMAPRREGPGPSWRPSGIPE